MANCNETIAALWELLDGELDAERAEALMAHLRACAPCKAQYDADRTFLGVVAKAGDADAPSHTLRHRITHALRQRGLA